MAAPILLLLLPTMGAWWSHPAARWGLAVLVLPLAVWVIVRGYRRHRRRSVLAAAALGVAFIVAGMVLPEIDGLAPLNLKLPAFASAQANADSAALAALHEESSQGHAEAACTETCCPIVAYDAAAGQANLTLPSGTLATLLGSVFLVVAHGINLHGCRCALNLHKTTAKEPCGCVGA